MREKMMEIENHHLATTTIVVDTGRSCQYILKLLGGDLMRKRILA